MPARRKTTKFILASPYGYITTKFSKKNIRNGAIGTVLENGRVRFSGHRETVEVPTHWRKQKPPSKPARP